jgi:hypothetical protein
LLGSRDHQRSCLGQKREQRGEREGRGGVQPAQRYSQCEEEGGKGGKAAEQAAQQP